MLKILKNYLVVGFLVLIASCNNNSELIEHFTPSGEYTLNWDNLEKVDNGIELRISGFSGLYYKGGRTFYAVSDQGPIITEENKVYFLSPGYTPKILELELQDDNTIKIKNITALYNPSGDKTSGISPQNRKNNYQFLNTELNYDNWGISPSGIYLDRKNNFFWISDLYSPSVIQTTVHGNIVKRIRPEEGLRKVYSRGDLFGGISGVDYDKSERLVGCFKSYLRNIAQGDDTSTIDNSLRRIMRVDLNKDRFTNPQAEVSMFYQVESAMTDNIPEDKIFLGDIKVISDTSYLVTEYGEFQGKKRSLLYKVVIEKDSTTMAVEGAESLIGKTFETLTSTERKSSTVKFKTLKKRLVLNLLDYQLERPEAITFVGKDKIAILENTNYGVSGGNISTKNYQLNKKPVRLKIIDLTNKL